MRKPFFDPLREGLDLARIDAANARRKTEAEKAQAETPPAPKTNGSDWDEALRRIAESREFGEQTLDLSGLAIDRVPEPVAGLTGLQNLYLRNTQINVTDLSQIAGLTGLKILDLSDTQITDTGLTHIAGLTGLQSLDLHSTQITDMGLTHIAGLTGLQNLELSDTQITDTGLTHITGLNELEDLYLKNMRIADLRPLLNLPMLTDGPCKSLHLSGTAALEEPAVAAAMAHKDSEDQRKALLVHLRSLPPWPEPLPEFDLPTAPAQKEMIPAVFKPISMSAARSLLEQSYPLVRDRCQAVCDMILDAQATLATQIPNEPEKLEAHHQIEQSMTYALGLVHGIHDALPEDFTDRPLTEAEVNVFRKALNAALLKIEQASRYVDRADHGVTYGGILRLGVASALGGVAALVPGVGVGATVPAVYACLYGKEGTKAIIGAVKSKDG